MEIRRATQGILPSRRAMGSHPPPSPRTPSSAASLSPSPLCSTSPPLPTASPPSTLRCRFLAGPPVFFVRYGSSHDRRVLRAHYDLHGASGCDLGVRPADRTSRDRTYGQRMAPRRKRGRENAAPESPIAWTLPLDLMLEILARSDHRTVVRCAGTCNLLRRDILNPVFIYCLGQADPCILAYLCPDADKPLILVHPCTPAAMSFCLDHLSPFMSRCTADIFERYSPVTSRHGLVLLRRRLDIKGRPTSDQYSDLCVYDPMSGALTLFSEPPEFQINRNINRYMYILLTAADGIDCSFLLLIIDPYGWGIKVQAASPCGTWGPVTYVSGHEFPWWSLNRPNDPAILRGGVIHWITCHDKQILSYNLATGKSGSMKLPCTNYNIYQLHLVASSDGKRLKLVGIKGFMMSVWLQLLNSEGGDGDWAMKIAIDMEENLRSLNPNFPPNGPYIVVLRCIEIRSCHVVLLRVRLQEYVETIIVDLNNKDMRRGVYPPHVLLDIDLPSRLESMKIFS